MSWGLELWDQYDNVSSHTSKGIDFCEKYIHFLRDRCSIETKYAGDLKGLIKKYQPKKKKDEEEDSAFSWSRAFLDMMKELHDLAGQHEVIAENTSEQLVKQLTSLVQELKQERKQHLAEGSKLSDAHSKVLSQLERSKKAYDKAYKESERALEAYRKADADINLSRADVEKTKQVSNTKSQQAEDAKNEYAAQLQKTNKHRHDFYTEQMPRVFQQLQEMDEKRINQIKHVVKESAVIQQGVIPIINTCLEGVIKASESVDATADSQLVVEKFKSGFEIPGDIPFEDLSNGPAVINSGNSSVRPETDNRGTTKGGVSVRQRKKAEKRGLFGIFSSSKGDDQREDFQSLNPNQRKRKLQTKLDQLKKDIAKETAEREGMLKMKEVYANNPALGDPNSLDKKIEENAQKLDALQQEYKKYEDYLLDAEGKLTRRGSDDSMNQSVTSETGSVINHSNAGQPAEPANNVPLEGEEVDDEYEEEFEDTSFPVIGTCRALYPFTAMNEGSVGMVEDEEMFVLENDQGDGWTRVRKSDNSEGFVPTSYIQCHFYDQDAV